jgi:hypothetical protein
MNTAQAKKLDFPKLLSKLGFEPVRVVKNGIELWYNSPFRSETIPSFHTSFLNGKWIWNDFGDTGGTVIDFAMRYQNTDAKGALSFLDSVFKGVNFSKPDAPTPLAQSEQSPNTFYLDRIQPIKLMKDYVENHRGIDLAIANQYLVEVVFTNTETKKQSYAVGIKNVSAGYEVRNPYFKTCIGKKGFTFLKGKKNDSVCVFEGFLDFPSCILDLLEYQTDEMAKRLLLSVEDKGLLSDVIILNTAMFKQPVLEFIQKQNYKFVHGFWDNDKTGMTLKLFFEEHLGTHKVISWNHLYHPHKDYNEAIMEKSKQK